MARVTADEILELFGTTAKRDQITAAIIIANLMVTNGPATSTSPALSAAELKEIERLVACHFCYLRDPAALRAKIGDSEQWSFAASVTTAWGQGLRQTVSLLRLDREKLRLERHREKTRIAIPIRLLSPSI